MLYIVSASVKPGRLHEYQNWIKKNETEIRKQWPKGWKLGEIYLSVFGFGGSISEIHWEIENYAAFDASAIDQNSRREVLMNEWFDFFDLSTLQGRVLKAATGPKTAIRAA